MSKELATVFKLWQVTLDLVFSDVFFTNLDKLSLLVFLSHKCGFLLPISQKHLEHKGKTLAGGEIGESLGLLAGFECSLAC